MEVVDVSAFRIDQINSIRLRGTSPVATLGSCTLSPDCHVLATMKTTSPSQAGNHTISFGGMPRHSPALRLALAMTILGTVGAFTIESGLDAVTAVFWRSVFGGAFLGVWCWSQGDFTRLRQMHASLPRRALLHQGLRVAAVGSLMVGSWVTFFASFTRTSIATTTIIYHVHPFFVVLIGAVWLKERVALRQCLWMLLAFVGLALASGLTNLSSGTLSHRWLEGIALTLISALAYALAITVARGVTLPPALTTFAQTVIGIITLAPFADFSGHLHAAQWGWLVGLGTLHTGVAYILMYSALPRLKGAVIGTLAFLYPTVAILIDWLCYGHALMPAAIIGMVLIAIATLGVRSA